MSSRELIVAYLRERYSARVFVPLAALIYGVGCVATTAPRSVPGALGGVAMAFLLILVFRIGDDVADREVDRVRHPERVLSRADGVTPMVWLAFGALVLSLTIGAGLRSFPAQSARAAFANRAMWLALLIVVLAVWYGVRARVNAGPLVHAHVILIKYPVFAIIASPKPVHLPTADAWPALLALYVGFCIYETLDDPSVARSRAARPLMVAELALLAGLQLFTLTRGGLLP